MRLDPQAIINSRLGIGFALALARGLPPEAGYRTAYFMADLIASKRDWELVQAAQANQWVVSGGELSREELDQAVQETLRNTAYCIYDLYHYIHDQHRFLNMVAFNSRILQIIERSKRKESGLIMVGIHTCCFEIVMQAATMRGLRALVITMPQVKGAYQWQMDMRAKVGMDLRPASMATLHQATHLLRRGGTVLTGLDRPFPGLKHRPKFFGRPASLPVHHIQLALKAEVPIVVGAGVLCEDGSYSFNISDPVTLQPYPNREMEIIANAEAVLKVAEEIICQRPQQWAMFYPVWKEALDEVDREA